MFSRAVAVLGIGLIAGSFAVAQQPTEVTVLRGTALQVTTVQPLTSETAQPGDDVPLRLSRPLVVNGVTLLAEGEVLHGRVTRVERAGPKCHYGQVRWKIDRVAFAGHGSARSRLYTDSPWTHRPVPDQLPLGREQSFADRVLSPVMAAPIIALGLIVESPRFLLHDERNDGCGAGKEYVLPAGSTLTLVITKEHHVRF